LPPGIHLATWEDVAVRFGGTPHRSALLAGLLDALVDLKFSGCRRVYLNGSFVTDVDRPDDFDLCWDLDGVDISKLPMEILDVATPRQAQRDRYRGDILPNVLELSSGAPFADFFQTNKVTGGRKGIVALDLEAFLG
jgi:hypothetical protein